jgi:ribosomal protein S18 acetylase RimI-like enzyme
LYEKMSFVPQNERKDYYTKGDDAVIYTLEF